MTVETPYEKALRQSVEHVHIVAARRGWDTGILVAEFDKGRPSHAYQEHTLTISIRGTHLSVSGVGIPHEWIEIGTGFIDSRFSQHIAALLGELERKSKGQEKL